MPFLVEVMSPEGTSIRVGLIITFTVQAFEEVRTWFTLLGFQIQGVGFEVCLAIPSKMSVISDLREFPEAADENSFLEERVKFSTSIKSSFLSCRLRSFIRVSK